MDCRETLIWLIGFITIPAAIVLITLIIANAVSSYKSKALERDIEKEKTQQAWIETVEKWDGKVLIIPEQKVE